MENPEKTGLGLTQKLDVSLNSNPEKLLDAVQEAVYKAVTYAYGGQFVAVGLGDKLASALESQEGRFTYEQLGTLVGEVVDTHFEGAEMKDTVSWTIKYTIANTIFHALD